MARRGVPLPPAGEYGVGMIFLPKEHASRLACEQELERTVRLEGQVVLGWRDVPVDCNMPMSPPVRTTEPVIRQIFIGRGRDIMTTDALERKLYVIRKTASHAIQALKLKHGKLAIGLSPDGQKVEVFAGLLSSFGFLPRPCRKPLHTSRQSSVSSSSFAPGEIFFSPMPAIGSLSRRKRFCEVSKS